LLKRNPQDIGALDTSGSAGREFDFDKEYYQVLFNSEHKFMQDESFTNSERFAKIDDAPKESQCGHGARIWEGSGQAELASPCPSEPHLFGALARHAHRQGYRQNRGRLRQILATGHDCQVVAPSLIPRKAGERVKTDRRDALKLSRLLRAGELTPVWVPDQEQEAMRDLTRARGDMKAQQLKARQQLNAFVLRHGHHWPSHKSRWTKGHYNWLESLTFERPWQQVVLQEYIDAVSQRVEDITAQMISALAQ
jgi:hypothetical protein